MSKAVINWFPINNVIIFGRVVQVVCIYLKIFVNLEGKLGIFGDFSDEE